MGASRLLWKWKSSVAIICRMPSPCCTARPPIERRQTWEVESQGNGGEEAGADGRMWGLISLYVIFWVVLIYPTCLHSAQSVAERPLRLCSGHMSCVLTRGFIHEFSSRPFLGLILVFRQPKPNWVPTVSTANAADKEKCQYRTPYHSPNFTKKEFGLSLSEPFRILLLWMLMGPCKWRDLLVCVSGRIQDCKPPLTALQLVTKIIRGCPLN